MVAPNLLAKKHRTIPIEKANPKHFKMHEAGVEALTSDSKFAWKCGKELRDGRAIFRTCLWVDGTRSRREDTVRDA